jgi:hypothetical protein
VNPTAALVIFLLIYALVGALFAFNIWRVSDRAAAAFRGKPWLLRQVGRDNPNAWRATGLVMLAFGVAMVVGMALLSIWHPASVSTAVVMAVLGGAAVVSLAILLRARQNHPTDPPEGRTWG